MEYREIMDLLRQGKKLVCSKEYLFKDIPHICIELKDGSEVKAVLDHVAKGTFGECKLYNGDEDKIQSVSVIGYSTGPNSRIKYIYANKQMDTLYAMLEDGKEVLYPLSILDRWTVHGEYEEPTSEPELDIAKMTVHQLMDAGYEVVLRKKDNGR